MVGKLGPKNLVISNQYFDDKDSSLSACVRNDN